jgi:heme exporter protein B
MVLMISLAIGTPLLTLVGAFGAALTLGGRGGSGLVAILVLPLYIPVLIFGTGSVLSFSSGVGPEVSFLILGAILVFAMVFLPFFIALSIKLALE